MPPLFTSHRHSPSLAPPDNTAESTKVVIQRLSHNPDIFLARNLLSQDQIRSMLIKQATKQGMKVAGTRQSLENTVRKNSYLTWLNCDDILSSNKSTEDNPDSVVVANVLESMGNFVMDTFVHESLHSSYYSSNTNGDGERGGEGVVNLLVEDLQIAKYDQGGKFEEHHDGYGRFLTVLTYLNGVGGTFFPYAQTRRRDEKNNGNEEAKDEVQQLQLQTLDGLLVVGKEGVEAYTSSATCKSGNHDNHKIQPATIVVHIEPGDAIVFYNYLLGERDLQSVHESLTVPCEKWIATNWVRCENLTGPLAHLYYERLVSSSSSSPILL